MLGIDSLIRGQGATMLEDLDPAETREWLEALDSVLAYEGADPGPPHPVADPVERAGHGAAGERGVLRARRAHRQLPVRGHPVRRRLPALLPRWPQRRPAVHPGAFV